MGWRSGQLAGQSEGKKNGDGAGAHGGQVAQAPCQNPMADGFGRMPVEAEVAAGDGEVGGDGQLFAGTRTEQGAVVADAQTEGGSGGLARTPADPAQQSQFARLAVA